MSNPDPRLPPHVEAILLDAGGVLLDLDFGYLRRLIEAKHSDLGNPDLARAEAMARREINRTVLAGARISEKWRDYFRILLREAGVPAESYEVIIDSLWSAHQRVGLWTAVAEGAPEAVSALGQRGFRLGVVSNAEGHVERDLRGAGFEGVFETVIDSHIVGVEKPDPAIFEIALERMKLNRETTIFVGDLPSVDVEGARAAGLGAVLLDRHDVYADIDVPRIRSLAELPALLQTED